MSSFIALMTSLCNTTESKAQPLCARVTSCLIAVRKPWGLKKPVIQKTLGRPLKIHVENWLFLSRNSVNQKPRVDDSHEIWREKKKANCVRYHRINYSWEWTCRTRHRIHENSSVRLCLISSLSFLKTKTPHLSPKRRNSSIVHVVQCVS